jgi:Zn-dependent protease with chaperone function
LKANNSRKNKLLRSGVLSITTRFIATGSYISFIQSELYYGKLALVTYQQPRTNGYPSWKAASFIITIASISIFWKLSSKLKSKRTVYRVPKEELSYNMKNLSTKKSKLSTTP